jgi:hypothetical protein
MVNIIGDMRASVTAMLVLMPNMVGCSEAWLGAVLSPDKRENFVLVRIKTFYVFMASENHLGTMS